MLYIRIGRTEAIVTSQYRRQNNGHVGVLQRRHAYRSSISRARSKATPLLVGVLLECNSWIRFDDRLYVVWFMK